jgi:predicted lipoprotein
MKIQALSVLAASTLLTACGGSSSSSSSGGGNNGLCAELASSASSCSALLVTAQAQQADRIQSFETAAKSLDQHTTAFCSAIGQAGESAALALAKTSLASAASAWQALEVMQFGPVTETARNNFYSWPLSVGKGGQIDNEIALVANGGTFKPTPSKRGLTAVEYVLYNNPTDASRCDYAQKVTERMVSEAEALTTASAAYKPSQSSNQQAEVQSVFDALFYLDTKTKSDKIQEDILPEGQNDSFDADKLEYAYADLNRAAVAANLKSGLAIFTGDNGVGFEELLVASNQAALASQMKAALQLAIDASKSGEFSQDWRAILTDANSNDKSSNVSACLNMTATTTAANSNIEKLCSLPKKIQPFTADLKNSMSIALSLSVPGGAAADGD